MLIIPACFHEKKSTFFSSHQRCHLHIGCTEWLKSSCDNWSTALWKNKKKSSTVLTSKCSNKRLLHDGCPLTSAQDFPPPWQTPHYSLAKLIETAVLQQPAKAPMMSLLGAILLPYQLLGQRIRALQSHHLKYYTKPSTISGLNHTCDLLPHSSTHYPSSGQWDLQQDLNIVLTGFKRIPRVRQGIVSTLVLRKRCSNAHFVYYCSHILFTAMHRLR